MITKATVQARLDLLNTQYKQTNSTLEAIHGAIQDCQYWLSQLEQPITEGEKSPSVNVSDTKE